ncbi:hypothetical protein PIB30_043223 [Stylosanthes scabra]|uniref:Uncharacterized protein n=1 Tax=Stylosanthes scabra TaxID=79078 RepID=A0ABU6QG21_9FABA|nr:hypothetical protein [Stylosanthes scabra]
MAKLPPRKWGNLLPIFFLSFAFSASSSSETTTLSAPLSFRGRRKVHSIQSSSGYNAKPSKSSIGKSWNMDAAVDGTLTERG